MHTYVRTYIHTYTARGSMDAWLSVCGAYDVHAGVQCACARADGDLRTGGGHERYTLCRTGSVRGQSSPSLRSPVGRHSQQRKRATRLREHTHTGAHLAAADDAAGHTRPDDWHLRPGTSRVRQERTDARLRKYTRARSQAVVQHTCPPASLLVACTFTHLNPSTTLQPDRTLPRKAARVGKRDKTDKESRNARARQMPRTSTPRKYTTMGSMPPGPSQTLSYPPHDNPLASADATNWHMHPPPHP